jgi:protein-tyrosine phosphatase
MIDLHGHYLPGVDDGAKDLETAAAMLRHAAADGIEAVVVTPHVMGNSCKAKGLDTLRRNREKIWPELEKNAGKIKLITGAEVYFTSELLPILKENRDLLTINNGSYFLLEFPADYIYAHSRDFIFKVLTEGFIPIISHAERNQEIQRSPNILFDFVEAGALCQINAGSLRGDFGNEARRTAFELLDANAVHVIASDAHNLTSRKPELAFVPTLLRNFDQEKVNHYLHDIPAAIIADEALPDIGEALRRKTKRGFFNFIKKRDS